MNTQKVEDVKDTALKLDEIRLLLLKRLDSLPVTERGRKKQATPKAPNAGGSITVVGV